MWSYEPFAEIDDPEPIYELDLEVSPDIPNEEFDHISFEKWMRDVLALAAPRRRREPGRVRRRRARGGHDDPRRPAERSCPEQPRGRPAAYRGRGLALLLKSHSLSRAAELGATIAVTDNDETNAPMLAVNTRLGYRPFARRLEWERAPAPIATSAR